MEHESVQHGHARVINYLLNGKAVPGLEIHNEAALRQCLERIPLTSGLSAIISKAKTAQQRGASDNDVKVTEQELHDAVAAFKTSAFANQN